MRVLVFVRPDILERCVPFAEDLDVHMGVEVHAPWHMEHAWILRTVEVADRLGTKHLGLLPDMGIFMKHYPPVWRGSFEREGARPEVAQFIVDQHEAEDHGRIYDLRGRGEDEGQPDRDPRWPKRCGTRPTRTPSASATIIPYFRHIQAKFYEMTPDDRDPSLSYDEVIRELVAGGWRGYLSSEYEGNRWIQDVEEVDSREQVGRQQRMFERAAERCRAGGLLMFDKYLIDEGSVRNTGPTEAPDGFAFEARLGYYRGIGLSMIEELTVSVDDEALPREAVRFDEGKGPLTLDEMETAFDRRWHFGTDATILVARPGGFQAVRMRSG